ncbi:MAG: hypothetical protein ACKOHH_10735, partial [Bacteroidota bacterium]
ALARRSEQYPNCIHFLQTMHWSVEERSILNLSFDQVYSTGEMNRGSDRSSELDNIRQGLVQALQQWNLKFG